MPPLQKQLLDIHAADGLQQKIDLRSLPLGKSTTAINLLKNKEGRLEKRLGVYPLPKVDPFGSGFVLSNGIKLATWNTNELVVVGRGTWTGSGAAVTALQSKSDDLGGMIVRGQMPDVKITLDQILANSNFPATSMCCAGSGDFLVFAWISCGAASPPVIPPVGNVYWCAIERSTGNFVAAPSLMTAIPSSAQFLRLATVGTTFVMCVSTSPGPSTIIQCATMTVAALESGAGWTNAHVGGIITANQANNNAFDMRAVTGDVTNFTIAYVTGVRDNINIVVDQRPASAPNTLTAQWLVENITASVTIQSLAIRSDSTTTNKVAVAYANASTGVSYAIRAATGNYPAMTTSKGPANVYTSPAASKLEDTKPPNWMDVTYGGSAGQTNANPTWTVSWSLPGSIWVGWSPISQAQAYRLSTATVDPSFDARIIQCQFFEGASNVTGWANTSGTNAIETPGVTLASRGIEQNGIAYFLGWIPSSTQGSFVVLAYDAAQDPQVNPGSGVPMRPVGILQTRTAIVDSTSIAGASVATGPNYWSGGSEWVFSGDPYGSAFVGYIGSTQGQRLMPAWGTIQMQPTTGYPTTQWGTMAAFGGSLPIVFDGQNPVEQAYLYVPESVAAVITSNANSSGPTWTHTADAYSWIFTWEWFDAQGNFHISARSTPVQITGNDVVTAGFTLPATSQPTFYMPSLGTTLKQPPVAASLFNTLSAAPSSIVTLGVYRTGSSNGPVGQTYFRVTDRYFNNADAEVAAGTLPAVTNNVYATTYLGPYEVHFQDTVNDGTPGGLFGASPGINDGTHPLLYGDGTNGAPGSLDNFCPPATSVIVRHKERLFVARGNQVLYTKQRGELSGPGYNEQVNSFFVGGDDPITGMESMDDKLVILKANQTYYVPGDGPADDGSGSSFLPPQPIPTDLGCISPLGVKSTPEGVYYMSTGGLRKVSRSLAVEYVGAAVEDEFATYNTICDAVLYPQANRLLFLANQTDAVNSGSHQFFGELVARDYFLDAWTTGVVRDNITQTGFVSAAVALASAPFTVPQPTLHLLGGDGRVWREHNPADANAYYDNSTYVSWTWTSPWIRPPGDSNNPGTGMQGRFRCWDMNVLGVSQTPHGLVFQVAIDYGSLANNRTWVWNQTNAPSIAPGGSTLTPLTQLRTYDGRMGEAFQFSVQEVVDTASAGTTGQGFQLLGLTVSVGSYKGPYGLPGASTQ